MKILTQIGLLLAMIVLMMFHVYQGIDLSTDGLLSSVGMSSSEVGGILGASLFTIIFSILIGWFAHGFFHRSFLFWMVLALAFDVFFGFIVLIGVEVYRTWRSMEDGEDIYAAWARIRKERLSIGGFRPL